MHGRASAAIAAALSLALSFGQPAAGPARAEEAVTVRAAPVASFDPQHADQAVFGGLRYLGGLQLDSSDKRFGGLSGLEISPDGHRLMMVSDVGDLFSATLDHAGRAPAGLSQVTVERLIDEDGAPLGAKFGADAEALRSVGGNGLTNDVMVAFERDNRVLRYSFGPDGRLARASPVAMPAAIADLPYNQGLEALAVIPPGAPGAGSLVALAESESTARPGTIPGWVIAPDGSSREIGLIRDGDFNVTDAVALANGDVIVLERRFNVLTGVAMRVRRISAAELAREEPISGVVLLAAGMAYAVDNMEGIAVHTDEAGRTVLSIISDDNFNTLQRTLLLQFELLDP
jgi:hypothetical protein